MLPLEKAVFRIVATTSKKTGTAWFFTKELLLTAAHCTGEPDNDAQEELTLVVPGSMTAPRLKVLQRSWELDVALLGLVDGAPGDLASLPLGKLPTEVPIGEPWSGFGFPRAHRDGLHPFGSLRSAAGSTAGQPALELHCVYGGMGKLEGLSGGPVCIGERVVGIVRSGPPDLQQLVIHATALANLPWPEVRERVAMVVLSPPPPPLSGSWTPRPPSRFFTGREKQLGRLHESLQQLGERPGFSQAPRVHAVCGLSGMGKTQLALRYAEQHRGDYGKIYWLEPKSAEEARTRLDELRPHLERNQPWLLIVDGADPPDLLASLLDTLGPGGRVLVTTEADDCTELGVASPQRLDEFTPEEALAFLLARAARDGVVFTASDQSAAAELAELLEFFPADLDAAGNQIGKSSSFARYLSMARVQEAGSRTLDLRIKQCAARGKLVLPLLEIASLLGKEAIPLAFLGDALEDGSTLLSDAADVLRDASLVRYERDAITLQPRVQRRVELMISPPERAKELLRTLREAAGQWLQVTGTDPQTCLPLVPHLRHLVRKMDVYGLLTDAEALLQDAAAALRQLGQLDQAAPFLQSHAELKKTLFREAEKAMVRALCEMAQVQHGIGQRQEARAGFQRALQLCASSEGERDNCQAEDLYRRVLESLAGLDYPEEQSGAIYGLVRVLCRQGQDGAALTLLREGISGSPAARPGGSQSPG